MLRNCWVQLAATDTDKGLKEVSTYRHKRGGQIDRCQPGYLLQRGSVLLGLHCQFDHVLTVNICKPGHLVRVLAACLQRVKSAEGDDVLHLTLSQRHLFKERLGLTRVDPLFVRSNRLSTRFDCSFSSSANRSISRLPANFCCNFRQMPEFELNMYFAAFIRSCMTCTSWKSEYSIVSTGICSNLPRP